MAFVEVTRAKPCQICGKSSWCSVSTTREVLICRRKQHEGAVVKEDKNGELYFVYDLRRVRL